MHPVLLAFRSAAAVAVPMGRFLHARWYIDARTNAHRSSRGALARTAAVLMRIAAAVGALARTAAVLMRIAAAVGRYLTRITAIRGAAARPGQPRRPAGGRPERPARGGGLGGSSPRMSQPLGAEPADLGVDEVVDLAVHHRRGIPGLEAGPHVLDVLVRVQNVVADLGAPAPSVVPAQLGHFGLLLRALALEQLGLQHGHRAGAVLDLAALVLAGDHDPGRQVRDPDRRVGGVDPLAAGAAGPEHVDPYLVLGHLDVVRLLHHRDHVNARERGLPAALVVVLRDPHHPVRAVLAAQRAVGIWGLYRERGRLDPRLFRVGRVVDLGRVSVPLGPAQVDPAQALGPVCRVGAARLRVDRDQRLARVVLTGQQRPDLQLVDLLAEHRQVAGRLFPGRLVALALGQLEQHLGVLEAAVQALQPGQLAVEVGQPAGDRLRLLLVFPQPGLTRALPEHVGFFSHGLRVEDGLHAGELRR